MTKAAVPLFPCTDNEIRPSTQAPHLHIDNASSGWSLIMQSGVLLASTTGIPLSDILAKEMAIAPKPLAQIDVMLLNGKPVDDPKTAIVPNGSRIALAAGLPGIAGLAMKSNSAVRGLRPGITHDSLHDANIAAGEQQGFIELALFCLALPMLGMHFLSRGIFVPSPTAFRYVRPSLQGTPTLDGVALDCAKLKDKLARLPAADFVYITAVPAQAPHVA